ncbi:GNAT family N-acetyltransferase [Terrabacter aerolatus]|uniref:GNAT family acetyltransferase n=1 Tax=Terrabacter aerolatus TaxID=422442 RepID=A0A512CX78_9MICO|nr:GNAT family acetyltransferase [Terrabacter aerolatus]
MPLHLPPGATHLATRPLSREDATAVTALMAACELHDVGAVVIEEADIVGDWQRPAFDLSTQTVGVLDEGRLVAYAEVYKGRWVDAAVHPGHRGLGIGTALSHWTRAVGARDGGTVVGQPVPGGSPGERLLSALGYRTLWTSWVLELPAGRAIEPQPLPQGYAVREPRDDDDLRATWTVNEDAFLEWSDRERATFEEWAATVTHRPGFEPWQLRLVVDPSDTVVGMAFVVVSNGSAYVDKLAVRRDERGKGLARALLVDAFEVARTHGGERSELSTDSRTGALGLYEKVGMQVTSVWRHWAADVAPAAAVVEH